MASLKAEVVNLLRANPAVRAIRIWHAGIGYDVASFDRVAGLIHSGAIAVGVEPQGPGASYLPDQDLLRVPAATPGKLRRDGVILHEAVHALQDVDNLQAAAVDAELAAYFVQATFVARSAGVGALTRGLDTGLGSQFRREIAALVVKTQSYNGLVRLESTHLAKARSAYLAWDRRPGLQKPYGFNGVPRMCRAHH